jgi:hypothetical protein
VFTLYNGLTSKRAKNSAFVGGEFDVVNEPTASQPYEKQGNRLYERLRQNLLFYTAFL